MSTDDQDFLRSKLELARKYLQAGEIAKARVLFEEQRALHPRNAAVVRGAAQAAYVAHDWATSAEIWRTYISLKPADPHGYKKFLGACAFLGDVTSVSRLAGEIPKTLIEKKEFALEVYAPILSRIGKERHALHILEMCLDHGSPPESWALLAKILIRLDRARELVDLLNKHQIDILARPDLAGFSIHSLVSIGDVDAAWITAKRLMETPQEFQAKALPSIIARTSPNDELAAEILMSIVSQIDKHMLLSGLLGIVHAVGPSFLSDLRQQLGDQLSDHQKVLLLLEELKKTHLAALERSCIKALTWCDLAETHRQAEESISRTCETANDTMLVEASQLKQALERRTPLIFMTTGHSYHDAAGLASWLLSRIEKRQPTSLIRIGDGEGNFLPYADSDRSFASKDRKAIQGIWWPEQFHCDAAHENTLSRELMFCIRNASAIGLPSIHRIALLRHNSSQEKHVARGLRAAIRLGFDSRNFRPECVFCSCDAAKDLEDWRLFEAVLGTLNHVSYVSCHDLTNVLKERLGLETKYRFHTPPEDRFSELMEVPQEYGEPLFPDGLTRFRREVDVAPGDVFLVGAGIVGKMMCEDIRKRGGIALDIGSVMDLWAGFATRDLPRKPVQFHLPTSLIEGSPIRYCPHVEKQPLDFPYKSDRSRRRFLPAPRRVIHTDEGNARVLLLGHPRCGSGYLSQALQARGLMVGHEGALEHGRVCWMSVVDDQAPPFGEVFDGREKFVTGAYMRNPRDAIPSIILENSIADSFLFRRLHILNALDIDLCMIETPLERAVASLVCWMRLVEQRTPALRVRVEHFDSDLETALDAMPERLPKLAPRASRPPQSDINASATKFFHSKPSLTAEDYSRLPGKWRDDLAMLCRDWGYPTDFLETHGTRKDYE